MHPIPTPDRLHGLDAVRGFALLLGVALHAAMSWLPGAEFFWVTADSERSPALAGLFFWIHGFRMTLFFVLAGFFARLALQRLGTRAFVRDRFKRIVLPLATLWFPILMAIVAVLVWNGWLQNGGAMPAQEPPPPLTVATFPLTHLWFLYVLTIFYVVALAVRALFAVVDRGGAAQRALDAAVRFVAPGAPLLVALPVAAMLLSLPTWWAWFGIPTPDTGLVPNRSALLAYGLAFAGGWALNRQPVLLQALARRWPAYLALAVAATATCLALIGVVPPSAPAGDTVADVAYAIAYVVSGWAWSFALLGLALRFLAQASPARRWLADASYWVYLVHVPAVMALQVAATQVDAPWWLEYPVVLAIAGAVLFGSYQLCVRHTWIGVALNGRKVAWTPRAPAAALPEADRAH